MLCWCFYIFCLWSFYEVTAHAQLKIARADSRKDKYKIKTCQYTVMKQKEKQHFRFHPIHMWIRIHFYLAVYCFWLPAAMATTCYIKIAYTMSRNSTSGMFFFYQQQIISVFYIHRRGSIAADVEPYRQGRGKRQELSFSSSSSVVL